MPIFKRLLLHVITRDFDPRSSHLGDAYQNCRWIAIFAGYHGGNRRVVCDRLTCSAGRNALPVVYTDRDFGSCLVVARGRRCDCVVARVPRGAVADGQATR